MKAGASRRGSEEMRAFRKRTGGRTGGTAAEGIQKTFIKTNNLVFCLGNNVKRAKNSLRSFFLSFIEVLVQPCLCISRAAWDLL